MSPEPPLDRLARRAATRLTPGQAVVLVILLTVVGIAGGTALLVYSLRRLGAW